ncbi:hypothetical protein FOL46_005156 [Perkinsus olseni]|uniref:U1-type domain-containing protein n=1 Tax=Perkinsus olseni TaxID=32597 RepID=A0A7J6MS14_PEROL|nr:hypothetical protein FOL46_005156 [Perkinsus olseni]
MGRKDDRRSRSKSHENKWKPPREESTSDDEEENQEPGFLGSLTAEERLELEKKKDEAGKKQYAKAYIEKEKRDQWEQNQKWQDRRNRRAVVVASAKEERVMKKNYAIYTGEEGEENYVEGEEAGWYYCRLCKKKSATFEMLEIHIGSKDHAKRMNAPEWYVDDVLPKGGESSTSEGSAAAAGDGDLYATAAARGKEGEVASDGSKILARGDVSYGWPQYLCVCENGWWCELCDSAMICAEASVEAHLQGQKHQKACDGNKLPRYRQGGGAEQAKIAFDKDGHLGTKKASWPPYIDVVDMDGYKWWKCGLCGTTLWSDDYVDDHLTSKRHQKNLVNSVGFTRGGHHQGPSAARFPAPGIPRNLMQVKSKVPLPPGGPRPAPMVAVPPGGPAYMAAAMAPAGVPGSCWGRSQPMGHQPVASPEPPMRQDMLPSTDEENMEKVEEKLLEKFKYVTDGELVCQLCCRDLTRMDECDIFTTGQQFEKHRQSKAHQQHVLALTEAHLDYYQLFCHSSANRTIYAMNHRTGELVLDPYLMREPRKLAEASARPTMPKALGLIHGNPELPDGMLICKTVPRSFKGFDYYEKDPNGKAEFDRWRRNKEKRMPWLQKIELRRQNGEMV